MDKKKHHHPNNNNNNNYNVHVLLILQSSSSSLELPEKKTNRIKKTEKIKNQESRISHYYLNVARIIWLFLQIPERKVNKWCVFVLSLSKWPLSNSQNNKLGKKESLYSIGNPFKKLTNRLTFTCLVLFFVHLSPSETKKKTNDKTTGKNNIDIK